MSFLIKVLVNGVALWLASVLLEGIEFGADGDTTTRVITVGAVALIFGVLNAILKPILLLLSLPLLLITLGLFTFIINAVMLWLTSWLSGSVGLDFTVDSFFWDAVLGALIITLVSMIVNAVLPDGR